MRFYKEEMKSLRTNTCYISLNIFWTALRHITKNKGGCSGEENLNFCVRESFLTVWDPKRMYSLALSFSSVALSCPTLCNTVDYTLLKLMSIESVMPSNHLVLCCPLLLLPSIFPTIRVFSKESVLCTRGPKYWSFSFSIRLSNEYSGLISFRMDWIDLRAVQETLKSLLRHHSSKASILWCSAFIMVQLSHPYMTTGKTIALTRWTFVVK